MTVSKGSIVRPDKRVGARLETLAYLFDVSVSTVERAIAAGRILPSREVFGVPLYHVETVEKAVFAGDLLGFEASIQAAAGTDDDPYVRGARNAAKTEKRRGAAA